MVAPMQKIATVKASLPAAAAVARTAPEKDKLENTTKTGTAAGK